MRSASRSGAARTLVQRVEHELHQRGYSCEPAPWPADLIATRGSWTPRLVMVEEDGPEHARRRAVVDAASTSGMLAYRASRFSPVVIRELGGDDA